MHPRARLSEYLERDLDPDERSQIDAHLSDCAGCRRELSELRQTVSLLRQLPEPAHPPALADAVLARLAREANGPARVRPLFARLGEPRLALPLAAALAGFFLMLQPADPTLPTAVTSSADFTRLPQPEWTGLEALPARSPRAGVVSGTTPAGIYAAYARRARLEEMARQLRGAGHPFSESLAAHFEAQPSVALADWQPR
jgi:anti-sigma factor RsiW